MRRLDHPTFFCDFAALQALADDEDAKSYPHLQQHVADLMQGYNQYIEEGGNAWTVMPVALPEPIKAFLRDHYRSASGDLKHLNELRRANSTITCTMCGSSDCGTLDHVLPQRDFACFAIFGINLVPACKCNNSRRTTIRGADASERVLHPYFDDVLDERIISAHFADLGAVPSISLKIILDAAHPEFPAAKFHVEKVVKRTAIINKFSGYWTKFVREPSQMIRDLRANPATRGGLVDILELELHTVDKAKDSKNSWQSAFVSGLLDDHVVDWLFDRFSRPGRLPDGSLLIPSVDGTF